MIKLPLLALVLALAGLLAYQWADWPPPEKTSSTQPKPADNLIPDGGAQSDPLSRLSPLDDLETYAAVNERTLFRPDRKPQEPQEDEPEAEPEPEDEKTLDGMDLSAVLITPTQVSAWVMRPDMDKPKPVEIGDELEGWTVKEILDDRVVLERQGEINKLYLRDYSTPSMPMSPQRASPRSRARSRARTDAAAPRPGAATPDRRAQSRANPRADGRGRRVAPPTAPQQRANVRRPLPQRPR